MSDSDSESSDFASEDEQGETDSKSAERRSIGKRKRGLPPEGTAEDETLKKGKTEKKKKRKRRKFESDFTVDFDEKHGINRKIGQMDGPMLVDYVASRAKKFEPNLTAMEMEERYIPASAIADTTSYEEIRDACHLPNFLEHFAGKDLVKAPEENGCPHTLVICASGIRAADVVRSLRKFQIPKVQVAKLFAKHFKLSEHVQFCKKNRMNIGVGTPQRVIDLIDDGALSLTHLKRIVVDASHIDARKRGVLDMAETQIPLIKLLMRHGLRDRYGQKKGDVQLLFY